MSSDENKELMERLARHSQLYERVKDLLEIVENAEADCSFCLIALSAVPK